MRRYLLSWVIGSACLITTGSARAETPHVSPAPSSHALLQSRRIGPMATQPSSEVQPAHQDVRAAQGSLLQVSLDVPAEWVQRSARRSAEVPAPEYTTRPPVEAMRPDKLTIMKSRHAPALVPVPSIQASMPPRDILPPVTKTEPVLQSAETLGGNLERTSEAPVPPMPQNIATLPYDEDPTPEDKGNLTITKTAPRRNLSPRPPVHSQASETTVQTLTTRQMIMLREAQHAQNRGARIQTRQAIGHSPGRPAMPIIEPTIGPFWGWHWHPVLQIPVYSY